MDQITGFSVTVINRLKSLISDKQQECDLPIYGGTSGENSQATPKGEDPATSSAGATPVTPITPVTPTSPSFEATVVSAEPKELKLSDFCK